MSSTRIPTYRHHKATGQAVVTIEGRDFYLGSYRSQQSQAEYDRLVGEWIANGRALPATARAHDDRVTVAVLVAAFWLHAQEYYRTPSGAPGKELECFRYALDPLVARYGDTPAEDFGPIRFKSVRQWMIDQGWSRTYINRQCNRIQLAFRYGVEQEMIPAAVHDALVKVSRLKRGRTTARESEPVKPVPMAHVEATLPQLSQTVRTMVEVQLLTAMRPGEVCSLRPIDIDTTGSIWFFTPPLHKNAYRGHGRSVAIGPKAQAILAPFLTDTPLDAHVFSPAKAEAERDEDRRRNRVTPLYPSHERRNQRKRQANPKRAPKDRYTTTSYNRAVSRACQRAFPLPAPLAKRSDETTNEWEARLTLEQKAEIRQWHAEHRWNVGQLRHTKATEVRKHFGLDAARKYLGHRSQSITEVYAERDQAEAAEIAAQVG